ncbi:hypothetical protein Y695_03452 [Hydrogenophaga sp. T4]|nr:hypothetical protein Y695_03452 [Hydrogenophaga sp. T4]
MPITPASNMVRKSTSRKVLLASSEVLAMITSTWLEPSRASERVPNTSRPRTWCKVWNLFTSPVNSRTSPA